MSVAEGKSAAGAVDRFLAGREAERPPKPFTARAGRLREEETAQLAVGTPRIDRVSPSQGPGQGLTAAEVRLEASRCLHCDCSKRDTCRLRYFAQRYGAVSNRYRGERKPLERHVQHADVIYEPGKCILCGLCVRIADDAGEPLGLTFVGRGFNVRVGVPFDQSIAEGLKLVAHQCVEACPTGALTLKTSDSPGHCCGCR
jgi:ferredoxin